MSFFLFFKQIADVLYQYRWLDYAMVCLVVVMLVYQFLLIRPSFKKSVVFPDISVIFAGILLTAVFFTDTTEYGTYFKVLSAFLMYVVGRVYYDRIQESTGALVSASYLIVYLNFFYRFFTTGIQFGSLHAGGDLYYYDTDMAFAMILAMVFIGMFGRNHVCKLLTVFFVCPYMVLHSDAGIQKAILFVVYILMAIYLFEKVTDKQKVSGLLLAGSIGVLLCMIGVLLLPVFTEVDLTTLLQKVDGSFFDSNHMTTRYETWQGVWEQTKQGDTVQLLFGTGLGFVMLSNGTVTNVGSLYIKSLYSLGIVGCAILFVFLVGIVYYVVKVQDRKTFYITVILVVMLLATGVTVNSLESTQMSWFAMMFAGMVVSSVQVEKREVGIADDRLDGAYSDKE